MPNSSRSAKSIASRFVRQPASWYVRPGTPSEVHAKAGPDFEIKHPRGYHGRFREVVDRIMNALAKWSQGHGPDDPMPEKVFSREDLRAAALHRGITVRPRSKREDLHAALIADVRAKTRTQRDVPKPIAKFTLQSPPHAGKDVAVYRQAGKPVMYEENDQGQRRRNPLASFDDLHDLHDWAQEHNETRLAEWARTERGVKAPAETTSDEEYQAARTAKAYRQQEAAARDVGDQETADAMAREAEKHEAKTPAKKAAPAKAAPRKATPKYDDPTGRQSALDQKRGVAQAAARLDEVLANEGSDRAVVHSINEAGLPDEQRDSLLAAFDADGKDGLRIALADMESRAGLTRIDQAGVTVPFDRKHHQGPAGLRTGQPVQVVRPGHTTRVDGEDGDVTVERATVVKAAPVAKATPAKKAAPPKAEPDTTGRAERLASAEGVPGGDVDRAREILGRESRVPILPIVKPEDRFLAPWAIDPANPDYAWLRDLHADHPALYNLLAQEQRTDKVWQTEGRRKFRTSSIEDAREEAARTLREAVADAPVIVRRGRESSLRDILDGGRMKTQFETGSSGGLFDPETRAKLEGFTFGLPDDVGPDKRPVYGVVSPRGVRPADEASAVSGYGDIQVVLKPSVRKRTTVTVGDSLLSQDGAAKTRPAPIDAPDWRAAGPHGFKSLSDSRFESKNYIEAQIHGGVGVGDIEEVVFARQPEPATVAALDRAGVSWRVQGAKATPSSSGVPTPSPAKKVAPKAPDLTGANGLSSDPDVRAVQVENRIRAAYLKVLNGSPAGLTEWVGFADLGEALGDEVSRDELQSVLKKMLRAADHNDDGRVRMIPVANTKALKPRDWAAAFQYGEDRLDAISFGDPSPRPLPSPAKKTTPSKTPRPSSVADLEGLDTEGRRDALDLKTVVELKALLKARGLPVSGTKRQLVDRLVDGGGGASTPGPATGAVAKMTRGAAKVDVPAVAAALRGGGSEKEVVAVLARDPQLTSARLKELAAALGIDVPPTMRAKTSLQLHIADEASRRFGPGDGALATRTPFAPSKVFDPTELVQRVASLQNVDEVQALLGEATTLANLRRLAREMNVDIPTGRKFTLAELRRWLAERAVTDRGHFNWR